MTWARVTCFFRGHIIERVVTPGYMRMPARCRRCDYTEAGIKYPPVPPMPSVKPLAEREAERVQIISAKPGDTIAVLFKASLTQPQRAIIKGLMAAQLPDGVKVLVLEGGTQLAHIEAVAE